MKITWFGGTTLRVHVGGSMVVVDAAGAGAGIDQKELVSGADRVIGFADQALVDAAAWRPRRIGRLMDEAEAAPVESWSAGEGALLIEAMGERPLLVLAGPVPALGRWVNEAVVVLLGEDLAGRGAAVLDRWGPRLLALGGTEAAIDAAIAALRERLDGTGLVALEQSLALEV